MKSKWCSIGDALSPQTASQISFWYFLSPGWWSSWTRFQSCSRTRREWSWDHKRNENYNKNKRHNCPIVRNHNWSWKFCLDNLDLSTSMELAARPKTRASHGIEWVGTWRSRPITCNEEATPCSATSQTPHRASTISLFRVFGSHIPSTCNFLMNQLCNMYFTSPICAFLVVFRRSCCSHLCFVVHDVGYFHGQRWSGGSVISVRGSISTASFRLGKAKRDPDSQLRTFRWRSEEDEIVLPVEWWFISQVSIFNTNQEPFTDYTPRIRCLFTPIDVRQVGTRRASKPQPIRRLQVHFYEGASSISVYQNQMLHHGVTGEHLEL